MTDSTQHALLRAICAHPEDDTARLVFADWLQENAGTVPCPRCGGGRPGTWYYPSYDNGQCATCHGTGSIPDGRAERAEFVRVQCELAGYEEKVTDEDRANRWWQLRRRERELLANLSEFIPDDGLRWDVTTIPEWRRGFLDSVTCTAAAWLQHADALHWHPGQMVECPTCGGCGGKQKPVGNSASYWDEKGCPTCSGTGRTSRPCPPTAQPVTRVTLTDGMESLLGRMQTVDGGDWDFWEFVPGPWFAGPNPVSIQWLQPGDTSKGFTDARWPGITFDLSRTQED